jgi:PEP-CTERM motif
MKLRLSVILLSAVALLALPVWANDICQSASGNLVGNCGFETGDFTNWAVTGNSGFTGVTGGAFAYSGNYGAYLGSVGGDAFLTSTSSLQGNTLTFAADQDTSFWGLDSIILQEVGSLGNNLDLYYFQFSLVNFDVGPNDFTVFWNGSDVGPDLVNAGPFPYTVYSGYLTGYSIPEPGTLVLVGTGFIGLAGMIRRKLGA